MAEDNTTDSQVPPQWDKRWELLWRLRVSVFYHLKRERFLDGVDRASKGVSAIGGAAAFASLRGDPELGLWFAGSITLVATISLVYGPAAKARRHSELARDMKRLEADLVKCGHDLSAEQASNFESKLVLLESGEPAALGALVTQCHNELAVALGQPELVTPLPKFQRLFKNWFDFDQSLVSWPDQDTPGSALPWYKSIFKNWFVYERPDRDQK